MKMAKTPRRGMVKSEKAPPASRSWIGLPLPPHQRIYPEIPSRHDRAAPSSPARTRSHAATRPPKPLEPLPGGAPRPAASGPRRPAPGTHEYDRDTARSLPAGSPKAKASERVSRRIRESRPVGPRLVRSKTRSSRPPRHATRARAVNPSLRLRFQLTAGTRACTAAI